MKKIYKPLAILTVIVLMILISCKKDTTAPTFKNTCNVTNPAKDIPWLKNRIDALLISDQATLKYQYVLQAEYRKKTVFIFGNCNPASFAVFPVYSCTNVLLGNMGQIPADSLLNQTTLWKSQGSLCSNL
jgi:hypothetical protein